MRLFILATSLLLLVFNFCVFSQNTQENLLKALLDLPAPAPFEGYEMSDLDDDIDFPEEFFSTSKIPPDNAPIKEIMAYWAKQNGKVRFAGYVIKPTDIVADRIFDEIKKEPFLFNNYKSILPKKKEYIEFIKEFYDEKSAEFKRLEKDEGNKKGKINNVQEAIAKAEEMIRTNSVDDEDYSNLYSLEQIKTWLTYNSNYFSDDLIKKAGKIKDRNDYINSKDELISLAKYNWKLAEPIAERLINDDTQPAAQTLAKWAFYTHYLEEEDETNAEKYRRLLKAVVADRKAANGIRDLALDALVIEKDFDGRVDWYLSLLEDETLYDLGSYTGLKTFMDIIPPEEWIPKMIELIGHKNRAVHNAAVRNLVNLTEKADKNLQKQILNALLPWLTDRNWAKVENNEREKLIKHYGDADMPEAIPALILVLQNEKPTAESVSRYAKDSNVSINAIDAADAVKDGDMRAEGLSETQTAAISALAKYKDSRAVPAMLVALEQVSDFYERKEIISAIIASGGYDVNQQLTFIEKLARKISSSDSKTSIDEFYYDYEADSFDLSNQIGLVIINMEEPDDNLVRLTLDRVKVLKKSEPVVSATLNIFLQKWKSKVLDIERLNSVGNNTADIETIIHTLTNRKNLRKNYRNQIFEMRGKAGIASGIAACMLENANEVLTTINSGDVNTRIAGLACARLLRVPLPVNAIGQIMNNSNPLLALAAERYLVSEDSYEARNFVLAKYPNEAKILGSRFAFIPNKKGNYANLPIEALFNSVNTDTYFSNPEINDLDKVQEKLREEVKTNADLQGVYAFLQDSSNGHQILRIYKDKAVYSWYEDDARFRERIVKKDELKLIFDFVADNKIEDLKPILSGCHHGCPSEEFVMFGRNGGRRVYIYAEEMFPQPLYGLKMVFQALEQGESKLRYWLQDKIVGLEILLDEKNIKAKSLWKNDDDFRLLVLDEKREEEIDEELSKKAESARNAINYDDFEEGSVYYRRMSEISKEIQKQRIERKFEAYSWRSVKENKLGEKVSQPAEDYSIKENGSFPEIDYLENSESIWKTRTSEFELRPGNYEKDGIWKVFRNGLVTQVAKDKYTNSIVTSTDGKWAIVSKTDSTYYFPTIYRLNLQTGKEYKIDLPKPITTSAIAYIKPLDKFLIHSGDFADIEESPEYLMELLKEKFTKEEIKNKKPEYYLFDANSGSIKLVTGEFTPLKQITFRNLQKTANADEFWAAIPNKKSKETQIGRYNAKTFKFTEVLKVPEIQLTSMDIWVDEKGAKLYFIYEGQLLSLPMKPNEETTK